MLNKLKNGLKGWPLIACVTLVDVFQGIWFGYNMGVFAGVMIADDFKKTFPLTVTNSDVLGMVSGIYFIGAALGSLLAASAVAGRLGRRRTVLLGIVLNTIGALLCALSWHLPQLIIGRFVTGFGVGITASVAPVLVAESVPANVRGKLVTVGSSCNVTAYSMAGWINYGFYMRYHGQGDDSVGGGGMVWRFPIAFQISFLFLIAPALWLCTESPRWLLLAGRDDEAKNVLARLAGKSVGDGVIDDEEVTEQLRSIQGALREEQAARVSGWDTIRCRDKTQNLRRVILSCGSQIIQQLSGINAVGFFMPVMFASMGKTQADSLLWTAGIGTFYIASILTSLLLVDSLGRRLIMQWGALGMGICWLAIAPCYKIAHEDPSRQIEMGKIMTAFLFLFHLFFGTCWGSVPWVYTSEINSLAWRARVSGMATASNWVIGFISVQVGKSGLDNLGWRFFLMWGIICVSCTPIIWLFYPETAGRTLEDMDHMFMTNPGIFVFNKREMTQTTRPESYAAAERARIQAQAAAEANSLSDGAVIPIVVTAETKV